MNSTSLLRRGLSALTLLALASCGSTTMNHEGAAATAATSNPAVATTDDTMAGVDHGTMAMSNGTMAAAGQATTTAGDAMAGMDHGAMGAGANGGGDAMAAPIGDGTRPTENGFTLAASAAPTGTGKQTVVLLLHGPDGQPVNDAAVEQTKPMHLIVVRHDLTGYQHVHPHPMGNGQWMAEVDFTTPGAWRLIADVSPIVPGHEVDRLALGVDVTVPGAEPAAVPLPQPADVATVDAYQVAKQGVVGAGAEHLVTFAISKNGAPATDITEYLGAGGHLVALAEATLAYTHLHAMGGPASSLSFMTELPAHGRYRLFLQFATGEVVHTAAFTVVG